MLLHDLIDLEAIKPNLPATNKRGVFQILGQMAGQRLGVATGAVVAAITDRERLGSTGFGNGVAIPHGKLPGLARIYCSVARLSEPIEFKAIDGHPVDLIFFMLSPPDAGADHLKALAAISRAARHAPTLEKLRGARSRDALAAVLMGVDERDAA